MVKKTVKKNGGSNNTKMLMKVVNDKKILYVSEVDDEYIDECNKFLELMPENPYFTRRRNFLLYKRKLDSYFKTYHNYLSLLYDKKEVFDKLKLLFYLVMFQRHMKVFYDEWYYSVVKIYEYYLRVKIVHMPRFVNLVSVEKSNIKIFKDLLNDKIPNKLLGFTRLNPNSNIFVIYYKDEYDKEDFEDFLKTLKYVRILDDFKTGDLVDGAVIPKEESKNTVVDYILKKKHKDEDKIDSMRKDFIDYFIKSKNIKKGIKEELHKDIVYSLKEAKKIVKEKYNNKIKYIKTSRKKNSFNNTILYNIGKKKEYKEVKVNDNKESYFEDVELFIKTKLPDIYKYGLYKQLTNNRFKEFYTRDL